jgi:hypothetical protein
LKIRSGKQEKAGKSYVDEEIKLHEDKSVEASITLVQKVIAPDNKKIKGTCRVVCPFSVFIKFIKF